MNKRKKRNEKDPCPAAGNFPAVDPGGLAGVLNNDDLKVDTKIQSSMYEEEQMNFHLKDDINTSVYMKAVYYPVTGNLYNYMCDLNSPGISIKNIMVNPGYDYLGERETRAIGFPSQNMCFHYLFPEETAE